MQFYKPYRFHDDVFLKILILVHFTGLKKQICREIFFSIYFLFIKISEKFDLYTERSNEGLAIGVFRWINTKNPQISDNENSSIPTRLGSGIEWNKNKTWNSVLLSSWSKWNSTYKIWKSKIDENNLEGPPNVFDPFLNNDYPNPISLFFVL